MMPQGLSELELRKIIEDAFLPHHCSCSMQADHSMTVEIKDPLTGRVDLRVDGIAVAGLNSSRAISNLIAGLRMELAHPQPARGHARFA